MIAPSLILTRKDLTRLMRRDDYLAAMDAVFRAAADRRAWAPPPLHLDGDGGAFHGKAARFDDKRLFVALKLNGNFPDNEREFSLPTIQGAILLCDGRNGALLAIMDSIEVTIRRTAAASALAAQVLAKQDARILTVCGCGEQGRAHALALSDVRDFSRIYFWDLDQKKAALLAAEMSKTLKGETKFVSNLRQATLNSDVIAACTTARAPIIGRDDIEAGVFIAAVGADNPEKNEIAPALMARARVVADNVEQCISMGDTRAAIASGGMTETDIHGELGDILVEKISGRKSASEIFVFDSTGVAVQDVASAAVAWERASEMGVGFRIDLGNP